MATTEGKSKRDLIWEQKKRAREQRAQGGNQEAPDNNQPINFAKKPLFADNAVSEPVLQPSQPLESQDASRARNQAYLPQADNKQQPNNPFSERREPPIKAQEPINQPNYSEYEPQVNRNRQQPRVMEEPQEARKAVNFNPSFEPSGEHNYQEPVRDSRDGFGDAKKRKADYGEELRNQMKQKEMQKQHEKNEARNSVQGGNYGDRQREPEKHQKNDYADFLRQQMKEKEEMKNRNRGMQNPEPQDYNPFGRAGAGAPNKDLYNTPYNPPPANTYNDPRQYPGRPQQQFNSPQGGGNFPPFPNQGPSSRDYQRPPLPQQQSYDQRQGNDNYQRPPQYQAAPSSGHDGGFERNPPRQEPVNPRFDRFGSADQLPRGEPEPVSMPSNLNNDGNNYRRGNTGERARGRGALGSEDTGEIARKEKMKQDFQKGLQEQVEYKKRMKEMELKKKREEERLEEDRLRKEQEELARRMEQENNKNKPKVQNPPQESNNFAVQEPKNRRSREKAASNPGLEDRNNFDQNQPPKDPYGGYPGAAPYNQQQQPPPYQQYQQPPPYPYNQYNQSPYPPQGYPPQGYPPQQPYYPPPQVGLYPPVITSELQNIRSEIQNQQQVLSKQLDSIKKEAMTAMEERNKAERELAQLREQLKEKLISEELYKKNLREALDRNSQPRLQKIPEAPTRNLYKEPPMNPTNPMNAMNSMNYDPYPQQQDKMRRHRSPPNAFDTHAEAPNLDNQAYNIRQTNQRLLDDFQQGMLGDSRTPYLDIDKTLAGDTKLIPLAVFDNRASMEGGNQHRGSNNDPLTLSKIQGYGMRPNSSKQWNMKDEDSIDVLLKAHGALRPESSESNRHGDTSRLIGKRLEETDALLRQGDIGGTAKIVDRYNNLRSRESERGETLNLAARNILGDKSSNIGLNQYGQMEKRGGYGRGEEAIKLNHTGDILPDLSIGGHGSTNQYEFGEGHSMNTTGMSFNVDRINLANEARLKKLENYGGGGQQGRNDGGYGGMKGKGNYYNNHNRGELEAIEESADLGMDENLAKIDKILGSYLKTHEEEGINKRDLMM